MANLRVVLGRHQTGRHNAVYAFDGVVFLIFHGYDAADAGKSKLLIRKLKLDATSWPQAVLNEK